MRPLKSPIAAIQVSEEEGRELVEELKDNNFFLSFLETVTSPGGSFVYQIQGAVCRLYDRSDLPFPCCSLKWRGKQPFWNRVGKRFVADLSTSRNPSYSVVLVGSDRSFVVTFGWIRLLPKEQEWWNGTRDRTRNKKTEKKAA